MGYEWDEAKGQSNYARHGVDFSDIQNFDWDTALVMQSDQQGEKRFAAIGNIFGRLSFVVYTPRGDNIRIISMRNASRRERQLYENTRRH